MIRLNRLPTLDFEEFINKTVADLKNKESKNTNYRVSIPSTSSVQYTALVPLHSTLTDINTGDRLVGGHTYATQRHEATTDPSATDDTPDFAVGDIWVNTSSDEAFICVDDTSTSAIWQSIGSGSSPFTQTGTDISPTTPGSDLLIKNAEIVVLQQTTPADGDSKFNLKKTGDSYARLAIDSTGTLNWGIGTAATNIKLQRGGDNILYLDDTLQIKDYLGISESKAASVTYAPSGYHYYDASDNRPRSLSDVNGAPVHDLGVQEQEVFEGNQFAMAPVTDQLWNATAASGAFITPTVTATPRFVHNPITHQTTYCDGLWTWTASYAAEILTQADLSMGVSLKNFSNCNKIKVTIKHKENITANFAGANLYICHSVPSAETPQTNALTLSTSWIIEEYEFDITSWDFSGTGECPIVGAEFLGHILAKDGSENCEVYVSWIAVEGYAV